MSIEKFPDPRAPINLKMKRPPRSRKWFGTVWTETDLLNIKLKKKYFTYFLISALDHTSEEKDGIQSDHYHVLIQTQNPIQHPDTNTAHWEIPISVEGAYKYCMEKGDPTLEEGELKLPSNSINNWNNFIENCKTSTPKEMIEGPYSKLFARYRHFAGEINNQYKRLNSLDGDLCNEWFYGPAGTGKSLKAFTDYPDAYRKNTNKWWDGYNNEDVVIIDDWEPQHKVLSWHLKIWADRYPFRAEIKGSSMLIRPKKL